MTDLVRGAELLDRLLCLARRIGFGDGAPAELRMADLAEFAAVHHEVLERFADNARLEAIEGERDEARAVARRLYRLGWQAPFPPDYDAYAWLQNEG